MKNNLLGIFFVLIFLLTSDGAYAATHYLLGVSAVDSKEIRWGGSTIYSSYWNSAVSTWNALGKINIAPDTIYTYQDLTISDRSKPNEIYTAQYVYYPTFSDDIVINTAKFPNISFNEKKHALIHELGHALGLNHSPSGNMMYMYTTSQTTLSNQDKSDYYYLWN